ncbi:metal-dependent hydrolase [Roseibium sp. RKSG952]|nr:metal-dependent hydrolase [Roseibium sp. RKSG952]
MDSLSQFVLGAAVSTAFLGRKIGPRKAALVGGVLGTLPDLDVLIPFADPIDSFVYHRGWTHSVFVHALAAPILGEGLVRLFRGLRDHRWLTWMTVFLCLSTHAVIDAMTIYGTRIFWPFYPDPVGAGSVFIIDPLYTLPLLGVVIWALFRRNWTSRLQTSVVAVLLGSSAYLGASLAVQRHVEQMALEIFSDNGGKPERVLAIAAPFNILVWKVIGLDRDSYRNLYLSLAGGNEPLEVYTHPRNPELIACLEDTPAYQKLDWFSRGFNRAELVDGRVVVSDLRMGLTPGYAFRFVVAEADGQDIRSVTPKRDLSLRRADAEDFAWLGDRLLGIPAARAAEAGFQSTTRDRAAFDCSTD